MSYCDIEITLSSASKLMILYIIIMSVFLTNEWI